MNQSPPGGLADPGTGVPTTRNPKGVPAPPPLPAPFTDLAGTMEILRERGAEPLDVPILQRAGPFLDLVGEELRSRIFLTDEAGGGVLCLRPEFTIPAVLAHAASGRRGPVRYALAGTVFRQHVEDADSPREFPQAGIEAIGEEDVPEADARILADALHLVERLAAERAGEDGPFQTEMGDQALFEAMTGSVGLGDVWRRRLSRLFGDERALHEALDGLQANSGGEPRQGAVSHPPEALLGADPAVPAPVLAALKEGDAAGVEGAILAMVEEAAPAGGVDAGSNAAAGNRANAGRSVRSIARRMMQTFQLQSTRLTPEAAGRLRAFLAVDAPMPRALEEFRAIEAGSAFAAVLDRCARRMEALGQYGVDPTRIRFRTAFGRRLDYYSDMVFEITAPDGRVVAAGGRYDRLLDHFDASNRHAVGFALWLGRLASARREVEGKAASANGGRS